MSPNSKEEEEYVDLYSDLFDDNDNDKSGRGKVQSTETLVRRSAQCTTTGTTIKSSSSLDDEVIFFSHLGSLETEVKELRTVRQTLTAENEQLKSTLAIKERTIAVLRNNISSLYKTAKLELERRSSELAEVRREYDTLVFRRRTSQAQEVVTPVSAAPAVASVESSPHSTTDSEKENKSGEHNSNSKHRDHYHREHTRNSSSDRHYLSHSSSLETSSRYSPYSSTPRSSTSSSCHRKEAVRPATEPSLHRSEWRCSSGRSSPPKRYKHHQERKGLFS